jgi:hypothetical protein
MGDPGRRRVGSQFRPKGFAGGRCRAGGTAGRAGVDCGLGAVPAGARFSSPLNLLDQHRTQWEGRRLGKPLPCTRRTFYTR